jgi:hypothetical protein
MGWAPFLDPELREQAGVRDAGLAWARAQQWRSDPEAERVSELAEDRLRTLRPDVMEGTDPVGAMRRVADAFDAPTVRTGQPAPVRAALPERDRTRRPGDAEIVRYVGSTAAAPVAVDGHTYPAGRSPRRPGPGPSPRGSPARSVAPSPSPAAVARPATPGRAA